MLKSKTETARSGSTSETHEPIALEWRPVLSAIVKALADEDYGLGREIHAVAPVSARTEDQLRRVVHDYGETLIELRDETWIASIAQWTGAHWDCAVGLFTAESGRCDMVLSVRVFETSSGIYRFEVEAIRIP